MTGESEKTSSLSISRYPGPACSYGIEDGNPVVLGTNAAFEAQFGREIEGKTVPAAFEQLDLRVHNGSRDLSTCLQRGRQFGVRVAPFQERTNGTYLVQTVVPEGEEAGFLLFVETAGGKSGVGTSGTLGIDHVASVVSHDLRNPLDVAKARLEAGRELDEDEHFEHVEQAHERMERIIQDVLTIARGEEVVEPDDTVDLTEIAETAWETVETNGATLTIDEPLPTAIADPDRVGRLFENLFRNAIDHGSTGQPPQNDEEGEQGDPVVTVGRLETEDTDGFYVADDGPGIPPKDRARVFEPGYSSDNHGTGLGLAIVARIVDLHGWAINVTSSTAGGARFEVSGLDAD
ncbi:MAG: HAMP domain-containing sensor histidine kinase [Halovenus sp.]